MWGFGGFGVEVFRNGVSGLVLLGVSGCGGFGVPSLGGPCRMELACPWPEAQKSWGHRAQRTGLGFRVRVGVGYRRCCKSREIRVSGLRTLLGFRVEGLGCRV